MFKLIKKSILFILTLSLVLISFGTIPLNVSAITFEDFEYVLQGNGTTVEITDYNGTASNISIPDKIEGKSVTSIGEGAFIGHFLLSVTIPNSVISIGNSAFKNLGYLENVILPESLIYISDSAFESCIKLKDITIPNNVISIGSGAFYNCNIQSVFIPSSVTSLALNAFGGSYKTFVGNNPFRAFVVDPLNPVFSSLDGVLFNKEQTTLLRYPCGNSTENYTIPNSVTNLENRAFYNSLPISVIIPSTITHISKEAFMDCVRLKSIILPNSINSIEDYAFTSCINLESITIPESVTNIGSNVFSHCDKLINVTLPNSINSISPDLFFYSGLTSITIPDSVTSIGEAAFMGCDLLNNVVIPNGVTIIEPHTFDGCSKLTNIVLPDTITSIKTKAFYNCAFKNIDIPNNLISIEEYAFSQCNSLESLVLPSGITNIKGNAFSGCNKLYELILPNSLTSIKDFTFLNCSGLNRLYIPNSIINIGYGAFSLGYENPLAGWQLNRNELLTIYGESGSYAQSYAQQNGIPFAVGPFPWSFVTRNNILSIPNAFCTYIADYNTQRPVQNAEVKIGSDTVLTDENGVAAFSDILNSEYALNITKSGYCNYMGSIRVNIGSAQNIYIKKDNNPASFPYISTITLNDGLKTYDLLKEVKQYKRISDESKITQKDKSTITINANWKGKAPKRYILCQNGQEVIWSNENVISEIAIGSSFDPGYKIYAMIETVDGIYSQPVETNLFVYSPTFDLDSESGDLFKIGSESAITVPKNLPVIGGTELKVGFDFIPATISINNDSFKIAIGVKDMVDTKENWTKFKKKFTDAKENYNKYKELKDVLKHFGSTRGKFSIEKGMQAPDVDIIGYVEGVKKNGEWVLNEKSIIVNLDAKYVNKTQYVVGPVPIYVELETGAILEGLLGISSYMPETGYAKLDAELTITPRFELGGGLGVVGAVTVGATGKAELEYFMRFTDDYTKASLTGSMSIKATALIFEAKKEIAKGTWTIYESYGASRAELPQEYYASSLNVFNANEYSILSRDYLNNPSDWLGGKKYAKSRFNSDQGLNILQSNVFPNAQPQMITVDNKKVLTWISDNETRSAANRTMLVYSVYDDNAGIWSQPNAVYDDGTADFYPELISNGENAYVVWQNSKAVFDETVTLEELSMSGEICVSKIDTDNNVFETPITLTNNNTLDTQPKAGILNDKICVAWTNNDSNDIFGEEGQNNIYYSEFENEWGEPQLLKGGLGPITGLSTDYFNNELTVAYVEDTDDNLETIDDREIYILNQSNPAYRLTNNDTLDSNPLFSDINGTKALYWYNDSNIQYLTDLHATPSAVFSGPRDGLRDDFKIISNSSGKTSAIWTEAKDDDIALQASIYNATAGDWGKGVKISNDGDMIKSPDGLFDEEGNFSIAFIKGSMLEDGSEGQSDLCILNVVPRYNIKVNDVSYRSEDVKPNAQMPIELDITNTGELDVNNLKIDILDGAGIKESNLVETLIKSGETKTITSFINIPDTLEKKTYSVYVEVNDGSEFDTGDNVDEITLGYTDIQLNVEQYLVDGKNILLAQVSNISHVPTGVDLEIRENSLSGNIIDTVSINDLAYQESKIYIYEITPRYSEEENIKALYVNAVASSDEMSIGDNSELIILEDLSDIEGIPIALTGITSVSGNAVCGNTLTAILSDSNNTGTLSYQWTRDGVDILEETANTYTLTQQDLGKEIAVKISSSIETGVITSAPTTSVEKGSCDIAIGVKPILLEMSQNSVTLTMLDGYEYIVTANDADILTGIWQDSNVFTELSANTQYDFYQRVKETATHKASAVSEKIDITIETGPQPTGVIDYFIMDRDGQKIIVPLGGISGYAFAFSTQNDLYQYLKASKSYPIVYGIQSGEKYMLMGGFGGYSMNYSLYQTPLEAMENTAAISEEILNTYYIYEGFDELGNANLALWSINH
jgi:hypothetical protein